jgi:hypothetical protein
MGIMGIWQLESIMGICMGICICMGMHDCIMGFIMGFIMGMVGCIMQSSTHLGAMAESKIIEDMLGCWAGVSAKSK